MKEVSLQGFRDNIRRFVDSISPCYRVADRGIDILFDCCYLTVEKYEREPKSFMELIAGRKKTIRTRIECDSKNFIIQVNKICYNEDYIERQLKKALFELEFARKD